jgi:hypothetical protein
MVKQFVHQIRPCGAVLATGPCNKPSVIVGVRFRRTFLMKNRMSVAFACWEHLAAVERAIGCSLTVDSENSTEPVPDEL